jgi:hypothetical protein
MQPSSRSGLDGVGVLPSEKVRAFLRREKCRFVDEPILGSAFGVLVVVVIAGPSK